MGSFEQAINLAVPVTALWAALKEQDTLFPKLLPEAITSIELIEGGEGQIGSIRKITFGASAPPGSFVKEKLTALDEAAGKVTTEEIEGGHLVLGFTKWVTVMTVSGGADKSNVTFEFTYEGGSENVIPVAVEQTKGATVALFTKLEEYIKSNA